MNNFRFSLLPGGKRGKDATGSEASKTPPVAMSPLPSPRLIESPFLESPRPAYRRESRSPGPAPRLESPHPSYHTSRRTSRRNSDVASRYFGGEDDVAMIKADVVVNWLHAKQTQLMWTTGGPGEGVILKQSRDVFVACPRELSEVRGQLFDAVARLNVRIAMTVNTSAIRILLSQEDQAYIELENGLRLQILPNISFLPTCQVHHFAAFIHDSATLVVWGDDPTQIVARVSKIEEQIVAASLSWGKEGFGTISNMSKTVLVSEKQVGELDDEDGPRKELPRRVAVLHSVLIAFTLALVMVAIGSGWRQIAIEIGMDKSYLRLAFAAVVPLQGWLGLFFFQSVVGCVAQIIGPISQTDKNSKFYSGSPPIRPDKNSQQVLPHVTIQCPVYKEGLHSVIMPTIQSLKAAISMYEMQGGSANIFINDDGMQLISEYDAEQRRDFYAENHIGWVARPEHNTEEKDGKPIFIRQGRFKKASNMNYALAVSTRVEEKLKGYNRSGGWTQADEEDAYVMCLQEVLDEDGGKTWAEGNIRIGDYILLIDSDTRVPVDCFRDPVLEMEQSPEVAIIQFPSGVLNITHSFFENGIAFFTTLVYTAISYVVACGDICPFVGHNAFIRWSAIQEVTMQEMDSNSGKDMMTEKYWSENTVSEDFELALRLQTIGYTIRLAYYKGLEFKEGVSLTVYDELARWKKYAYGCSELIFHPLYYWPTRGPFTPLFRKFISSGMPLPSKISVLSYVGTYYAIGSAYVLITANFFLVGWYLQSLDHYYMDSFRILFSILIVFSGFGMFSIAILRYRIGEMHFLASLWQNVKWVLLLYIFFGGISIHVSGAILSHMFGINVQWGATIKEVQDTTFFVEIGKLVRKFWMTFTYCFLMIALMVYMTQFAPPFWRISEFIAVVPLGAVVLSHFLMPIALNPSLMLFTW